VAQRCHWNANDVGAPLHAPTDAESDWPTTAVPVNDGEAVTAGRAAAPPALVTAVVAGETAEAAPPAAVAVTATVSAWPLSSAAPSCVGGAAPTRGMPPGPTDARRGRWYAKTGGLPPFHVPATAASRFAVCATPTIVGGDETAGTPPG